MLARLFHAWERRLASETTNRVARPFEWGTEWVLDARAASEDDPASVLHRWSREALDDSSRFFEAAPADDYVLSPDGRLTFTSALSTPHPENNVVHARLFPAEGRRTARRAVLVLPQWNADEGGHVGLCRILARFGLTALRLSLPYHDRRMPAELERADYIVSANVGRTLQVCRQAVLDARRAIAWLAAEGYDRIGILGTSLGSCLSLLTMAHEPLIRAAALNHVSLYFADVVWRGLSTAHVRASLDPHLSLDCLRRLWLPISPKPYVSRLGHRRSLLVYAAYDLTFPPDLSRALVADFRAHDVPHEVAVLPCGHYSSGKAPFSWLDGFVLTRFLLRHL